MIETERAVMANHAAGEYVASHFRYASVYGPYSIFPFEWKTIRRILDGRRQIIIQDGGQHLFTRCAAPNAAHAIGLAIDRPEASAGQIYNVGDDRQFTHRQWLELLASAMDYEFEFVDIPYSVAPPGYSAVAPLVGGRYHRWLDTSKAKVQLGYTDVVRPEDWVRESVQWSLASQATGTPIRDMEGGPDYPAEDRLIAAWQDMLKLMPAEIGERLTYRHPYDHPKAAQA
jgi:nucleoside-diphosphate-sugar epimerase